jgi:hypothetical protein
MTKRSANSALTFKNATMIEGVITGCGGNHGSEPTLVLFLRPWRQLECPAQHKELRVEVPMKSEAAMLLAMQKWNEGLVAMTVRTIRKATKLYVERIVAQSSLRRVDLSPDLQRVSEEQRKPKFVTGPVLGRLKLERDYSWYVAQRTYIRTRYSVIVDSEDPDNDGAVAKVIRRAENLVPRIEQALPQLRDAIARDLLNIYNDSWRENRPSLSATDFARRHKLCTVQIGKDRITLHFENGGLFTEHIVEVRLSPRLGVQEILVA